MAKIKKVIVVAADLACLEANTCIIESVHSRQNLGKESRLYLFGNFQLLGSATFGFQLLGSSATLLFDMLRQFVATHENESVPVEILKTRKSTTPRWGLRRMMKVNSTLLPFVKLGDDILSSKNDVPALSDQFVFVRVGKRRTKGKYGSAVWRRNRHPTITRFIANINEQTEPQLVQVESQTTFLIADPNVYMVQAEVELSLRNTVELILLC